MPPKLITEFLVKIWQGLQEEHIAAALAGGLALPVWNFPRSTQDIDFLILAMESDNALLHSIARLGCHPRKSPPFIDLGVTRILPTIIRPQDSHFEVAVDFLVSDSAFYRRVLARSQPIQLDDVPFTIDVVSCEDLILLKLQSGRILDLADCQRLMEINRDTIDWQYLQLGAKELGVAEQLNKLSSD